MEAKDILLGAMVGAGGIGAALYFTGYFEDDEKVPVLVPPAPRPALPAPVAAPVPIPVVAKAPPVVAPVPVKPAAPAIDIEAVRREAAAAAEAKVKAEFAAREAAAKAEAERKRLTGEGWTRPTARQGRGRLKKKKRLEIPEGWDEAKYLAKYPDVKRSVDAGAFPSGLAHYLRYGKKEGRTFKGWLRRPGYLAGIFANWDWRF
jgi:hypothetical protein